MREEDAGSLHRTAPAGALPGVSAEAEALAAEILATVHEPFLLLDSAARVRAASTAFYLRFGLSSDETLGRRVDRLGRGEWDVPELRELLERVNGREVVEDYEVALRSPTYGYRRIRLTVRPVRHGGNRVDLLLMAVREAPAEAPQPLDGPLHRLVAEASGDLVMLHRRDGTCLYVGAACEPLLGYSSDELRATPPCELLYPDDAAALRERLAAGPWPVEPVRITLRVRRKLGAPVWLETQVRAVRDPSGQEALHSSSRDVTERKRAEDALRWLSRQTKMILDTAAEGILGLDLHGGITFINPAAARMLGYPVTELLGRPCALFARPAAGAESAPDTLQRALREGVTVSSSSEHFWRRDDTSFPVEFTCTPTREHGEVTGAVVTFRDLTERRLSEDALRRAEWLAGVGETVLALRHEINNPLTSLIAEAGLLEMGGNSPAEEREMVANLAVQARRIRDVVRRLTELQSDPTVRVDGATRMLDLSGASHPER